MIFPVIEPVRKVGECSISAGVAMIGALLLGLICGVVARMLVPGDVFRHMSGPVTWLVSLGLGLLGALVGYLIFATGRTVAAPQQ
jgi:uncharacterized membrane protein YeaQ/YmgE (transglycosylase-associated protein family)